MSRPSEQLKGYVLNGWTVVEPIMRYPGQTGAQFSVGYIVEKNGTKAFLKAMDYGRAVRAKDPTSELQKITAAIVFERDILIACAAQSLSKVVRLLDHGSAYLTGHENNLMALVQYFVFELAEGDVRKYVNLGSDIDAVWTLKAMHQTAIALNQLHSIGAVHQDLKPSNVLTMRASNASTASNLKLADLGCGATRRGPINPRSEWVVAGDPDYAPLEALYSYTPADWVDRREACDAYLLGSMLSYFFCGIGMTQSVVLHLDTSLYPSQWKGNYADLMPMLNNAHAKAVEDVSTHFPKAINLELKRILLELTMPDPHVRGDPKARSLTGRPVGLDRYISRFNRLSMSTALRR